MSRGWRSGLVLWSLAKFKSPGDGKKWHGRPARESRARCACHPKRNQLKLLTPLKKTYIQCPQFITGPTLGFLDFGPVTTPTKGELEMGEDILKGGEPKKKKKGKKKAAKKKAAKK